LASSKLTAKSNERKATRKRKIAQQVIGLFQKFQFILFYCAQVITEPEIAAKRRIKKQQAKKEARKKKINNIKGKVRKDHRVNRESDLDF